jgi:hypothetical protein
VKDLAASSPKGPKKATSKPRPKTIDEALVYLSQLGDAGRQPSTDQILRAFPKKAALLTSPAQREELAHALARLDPSWAARLAIVVQGLPERTPTSTGTLAHVLARAAQAETQYPTETDAVKVRDWAANFGHDTHRGREPLAQAIAAAWPDRFSDGGPEALALLLAASRTKGKVGAPSDVLFRLVSVPPSGAANSAAIRWLVGPLLDRLRGLEHDLAEARTHLSAVGRRNDAVSRELDAVRARLGEVEAALETASRTLRETEQRLQDEIALRERTLSEAAGTAQQQKSALVTSYSRDFGRMADDIVDYLDRPMPNVGAATRRAVAMVELAARLEAEK